MDFNFVKFSISIDGKNFGIFKSKTNENEGRVFLLCYKDISSEDMLDLLVNKSLNKSRNYPNQQIKLKAPIFSMRKSVNIPTDYQTIRRWRENIQHEFKDLLELAQNDPCLKNKAEISEKIKYCVDKISKMKSSEDFTKFFANYHLPLEK